jgi:hypothetical protein
MVVYRRVERVNGVLMNALFSPKFGTGGVVVRHTTHVWRAGPRHEALAAGFADW